jgi:protein-S-isoprenylcysteine O-methyltransferase Ste14
MRPAFVGYPLDAAMFGVSLLVWMTIEVSQSFRHRAEATNQDRGSMTALRLTTIAGILLAAFALRLTSFNFPYNATVFGGALVLVWAGIALRVWCFITLGRYFTFTVQTSADQPIITSGPYRWLRHPSYLGLLLIIAGIGVTYENPVSAAAIIGGVLVGLINRIRVEEAALAATKGAAYSEYAKGRKRILPFVW